MRLLALDWGGNWVVVLWKWGGKCGMALKGKLHYVWKGSPPPPVHVWRRQATHLIQVLPLPSSICAQIGGNRPLPGDNVGGKAERTTELTESPTVIEGGGSSAQTFPQRPIKCASGNAATTRRKLRQFPHPLPWGNWLNLEGKNLTAWEEETTNWSILFVFLLFTTTH